MILKDWKAEAIMSLVPDAKFAQSGGNIYWDDDENDGVSCPTDSEIEAKIIELKADYNAKQYQRDREYPSIQDQLDMQYWDAVNGTTTWKDAIAEVKADNPKPTE